VAERKENSRHRDYWQPSPNDELTNAPCKKAMNVSLRDRWNSSIMGRYGRLGHWQNVAISFG
jgi:hypothetical protein